MWQLAHRHWPPPVMKWVLMHPLSGHPDLMTLRPAV